MWLIHKNIVTKQAQVLELGTGLYVLGFLV